MSDNEGWKKFCDYDNPILKKLARQERREIEVAIDGEPPFSKCMSRGALVEDVLAKRPSCMTCGAIMEAVTAAEASAKWVCPSCGSHTPAG